MSDSQSPQVSPTSQPEQQPQSNPGSNPNPVSEPSSIPIAVPPQNVSDIPEIVDFRLNEVINSPGVQVVNQQGNSADGSSITKTTFETVDKTIDVDITQNLNQVIQQYYDNTSTQNSQSKLVVDEIKSYAAKIKCDNFHGKGTIEDYNELFLAASKIANESRQMQLNVDIEGFNEFANAADELSSLFQGFIVKLQSINIIDDLAFLRSVAAALKKIANLAEVFGKFKETIIATATVQIPKSSHDAKNVVEGVMSEISCAMNYINHFVDPSHVAGPAAELSVVEKNVISKAVDTIKAWSVLSDQDVSVSMTSNADVTYIKQANAELRIKAGVVRNNVNTLRAKLAVYKNI